MIRDVSSLGLKWQGEKGPRQLTNLISIKISHFANERFQNRTDFLNKVPGGNGVADPANIHNANVPIMEPPQQLHEAEAEPGFQDRISWIVPPRVFEVFFKGKLCTLVTKRVRVAASLLDVLKGKANAWGVIADEDLEKGDFIGVYGGAIEERLYAELL